jgi:hypothetical protein
MRSHHSLQLRLRSGRHLWLLIVLLVAFTLGPANVEAQPLPCETEVLAAIDQTQATLSGIDLPLVPTFILTSSIGLAENAAEGGRQGAAIFWTTFFRNRVQFYGNNGTLDSADANALSALATEVLLLLNRCTSTPRVSFFSVRSDGMTNELFWVNPSINYSSTRILYRTDTFPAGPNDPAAMLVGDVAGAAGAVDSIAHGPLTQGTTYFYSAFVDDGAAVFSAAKRSFGQPRDDSGPFNWSYTMGGPLPIAGVHPNNRYYALSNDALHLVDNGVFGGRWPVGLQPAALADPPSVTRPVPVSTLDRVFVSTRSGKVLARDLDGNPVWESPVLGTAVDGSITLDSDTGIVFVGARVDNGDSRFYGLRLSDGQIAWSFDNGGGASGMGPIVGGAAWNNGRVYFASTQKPGGTGTTETVFCLSYDDTSATKEWSASIGDAAASVGASFDGSVQFTNLYAANTSGELYAFDLTAGNEGNLKWIYDTQDGPVRGVIFSVFDSQPIFFSTDSQVQSIDQTGSSLWQYNVLDPSPVVVLLVGGPSRVYVGGADNVVYSIRASDGGDVQPFVVGTGASRFGSPSIDVGGLLLIGSENGVLYGLDFF